MVFRFCSNACVLVVTTVKRIINAGGVCFRLPEVGTAIARLKLLEDSCFSVMGQ